MLYYYCMNYEQHQDLKESSYYRVFESFRSDNPSEAWEDLKEYLKGRIESYAAEYYEVSNFEKFWKRKSNCFDSNLEVLDQLISEIRRDIDSMIFFYTWGRDCDLCESDSVHFFLSWYEAAKWIQSTYENAEGPTSVSQIDLKGYLNFERSFRDRALEQFEERGY